MQILRICTEVQPLTKYCLISDLILLKIKNMMDIKEVLLQWFIKLFDKMLSGGAVKSEIMSSQVLPEKLH